MPPELAPHTAERLAFVRYLYRQGVAQMEHPEPLSSTALLSFHDAIEVFLSTAAIHKGVSLKNTKEFMQYWERIPGLPSKEAMRRLNEARVGLKHHGLRVSRRDMEELRSDASLFLYDATRVVFDVDLETVSMLDLVPYASVRETLREADGHAEQGSYAFAVGLAATVFEELLQDFMRRNATELRRSPYAFGVDLRPHWSGWSGETGIDNFIQQVNTMSEVLSDMQRAMRIMATGLDYHRYARMSLMRPPFIYEGEGQRKMQPRDGYVAHTGADYQFCRDFVIDSALHLAQNDATTGQ